MTKKFHIAIFILTMVFFIMPVEVYACETSNVKVEKSCCKKNKSVKKIEKDCCNKKSINQEKNCRGKCGHSNCVSSTTNYSLVPSIYFELNTINFVCQIERQKFYFLKNHISSGFYSIWSPPNIG